MSKITLSNISSFQNDTTAVAANNANNATLTTAFDNTLSRDGTSPNQMGASLDMNGNRLLNLPAPASSTDPVRVTDLNSYIIINSVLTVATLPSASVKAQRSFVSDATVAASGNFGAIVAGGGTNNVPVYSDGTNWRIG